jgi:hypothetical protein
MEWLLQSERISTLLSRLVVLRVPPLAGEKTSVIFVAGVAELRLPARLPDSGRADEPADSGTRSLTPHPLAENARLNSFDRTFFEFTHAAASDNSGTGTPTSSRLLSSTRAEAREDCHSDLIVSHSLSPVDPRPISWVPRHDASGMCLEEDGCFAATGQRRPDESCSFWSCPPRHAKIYVRLRLRLRSACWNPSSSATKIRHATPIISPPPPHSRLPHSLVSRTCLYWPRTPVSQALPVSRSESGPPCCLIAAIKATIDYHL